MERIDDMERARRAAHFAELRKATARRLVELRQMSLEERRAALAPAVDGQHHVETKSRLRMARESLRDQGQQEQAEQKAQELQRRAAEKAKRHMAYEERRAAKREATRQAHAQRRAANKARWATGERWQ